MTPMRIFDYAFIQHILKENNNSFGQILEEYYDSIKIHVKNIIKNETDAEDLTNDIFIKVYNNLDQFKPEYKFKAWLYKIATNSAIDFLRKKNIRNITNVQLEDNMQIIDDQHPEKIFNV